jgi:hypothetical protein
MGEVINFSGVNIYTLGLFAAFSFLWGSFVFYKKSSETHIDESSVLDAIVMVAFWGLLVSRLGFVLLNLPVFMKHWGRVFMLSEYPGMNRWFALIGFLLAVLFSVRKKKGKHFDYLDMFALGYLQGVSLMWAFLSLVGFEWQKILIGSLYLAGAIWLWRMEKTYRFLDWYKGNKTYARTGFVFSVSVAMVGALYLIELLTYSVNFWYLYLFGFATVIFGLALLYIRSGRMIEEDFKIIKKWKKIKQK